MLTNSNSTGFVLKEYPTYDMRRPKTRALLVEALFGRELQNGVSLVACLCIFPALPCVTAQRATPPKLQLNVNTQYLYQYELN